MPCSSSDSHPSHSLSALLSSPLSCFRSVPFLFFVMSAAAASPPSAVDAWKVYACASKGAKLACQMMDAKAMQVRVLGRLQLRAGLHSCLPASLRCRPSCSPPAPLLSSHGLARRHAAVRSAQLDRCTRVDRVLVAADHMHVWSHFFAHMKAA